MTERACSEKSRSRANTIRFRLLSRSANELPSRNNWYAFAEDALDDGPSRFLTLLADTTIQVNCLSEIFFDIALETARQLDAEYEASGVLRGPLHGLPVSLKDCFKVAGTDASIGCTAFASQPTSEAEESEVTKIMRQSGAILFCKTNVPMALMSGEVSVCVRRQTDLMAPNGRADF